MGNLKLVHGGRGTDQTKTSNIKKVKSTAKLSVVQEAFSFDPGRRTMYRDNVARVKRYMRISRDEGLDLLPYGTRPLKQNGQPVAWGWERDDKTSCWNFTGHVIKREGYGLVNITFPYKGTERAHRFFWRMWVGEIPEGKQLDHLCRNRACVNPCHLQPVSARTNIRRAFVYREPKKWCKRGHRISGSNIKWGKYSDAMQCRTRSCLVCHEALAYYRKYEVSLGRAFRKFERKYGVRVWESKVQVAA